jgi:hypothetical protein
MAKVRPAGRMRPSRLFFAALELKENNSPLKKIWLLKPKNYIFEERFWNLLRFSKNFEPLQPLEQTCGPQNIKIIKNGPWLKKLKIVEA